MVVLALVGRQALSEDAVVRPPTGARMRILLLQSQGVNIQSMYQPAMDTLVAMLGGYVRGRSGVAFDHGAVLPDQLLMRTMGLQQGDVFVWLGIMEAEHVPWAALARRGVCTVYYRTEPLQAAACPPVSWLVAETWEYTFANMKPCRSSRGPVVSRYVPPGALGMISPSNDSHHEGILPEQPGLVFIGHKRYSRCRLPPPSAALLQSAESRAGWVGGMCTV
jgi:hypothetical protein